MRGDSHFRSLIGRCRDERGELVDGVSTVRSYTDAENSKIGAQVLRKARRDAIRSLHDAGPLRPGTRKPDDRANAEAKAAEYARWLFARDGGDLTLVSERARRVYHDQVEAHATRTRRRDRRSGESVTFDPAWPQMPTMAEVLPIVDWLDCAAGRRPAEVSFRWGVAPAAYAKGREVPLPGWSFDSAVDPVLLPEMIEPVAPFADLEAMGLFG